MTKEWPTLQEIRERIAMKALRASVHFSGQLVSIVETKMPISTLNPMVESLQKDITAMQAFVDLLIPRE